MSSKTAKMLPGMSAFCQAGSASWSALSLRRLPHCPCRQTLFRWEEASGLEL